MEFISNGMKLADPDGVSISTEEYYNDQDLLHNFIEDHCIVDQDSEVLDTIIYKDYCDFVTDGGYGKNPMSKKTFSTRMGKKGYERRKSGKHRFFLGIKTTGNKII